MDFLSFLKTQIIEVEPRIEAPLEGVWKLDFSRRVDDRGCSELSYAHDPSEPEDPCWEFRGGIASSFLDCHLCPAGEPKLCPVCRERTDFPYRFDPVTGVLGMDGYRCRVEILDARSLVLLEMEALGMGIATRSHYWRVG